jgi:hypothetical protein
MSKVEKEHPMRIQPFIACAALGVALAATAQPALPASAETARPVATSDIEAETARMARRYGLSVEQAEKVRAILTEYARKAELIDRQQLTPEETSSRLKSLKDEESSWLSIVLGPEQRRQFRLDPRS